MHDYHHIEELIASGNTQQALTLLLGICRRQQEELDAVKAWNPLYGKRIYFLGSSWTYGSGCDGKDNFAMRIARKNHMEYINESVSGTTFVPREGRSDSYYERAGRFPEEAPDYVLIQLSSNDPRLTNAPVGHAADFYLPNPEKGETFDLSTIAGAIEATVSKLMNRYPGAKFAWYTGFQGPVLDSEEAQRRMEESRRLLTEEIAPKWGTPVCDLTHHLGMNTFMPRTNALLTIGDGQHCVSAGYAAWETAVEAFLKSL